MTSTLYKEDVRLISECAEGDPEAWARFIEAYGRLIRATVRKLFFGGTGSGTDVEDLEHHVYEKLLEDDCRRLCAWRRRSKFSTYLVQVVRNLVFDHLRKELRGPRVTSLDDLSNLPAEDGDSTDSEELTERKALLCKAIDKLSAGQTLIMRLRLEGKTLREIAEITNRPVGTVSVENSRALAKLRAAMKDLDRDDESGEQR